MISRRFNRISSFARRAARLIALALLVLPLCACSVAETLLEPTGGPEVTSSDGNVVVIQDTEHHAETPEAAEEDELPALGESETPAPSEEPAQSVSSTTGRPLPEGSVYRPVLVVMDNAAQSRPQTALMLADIVYEFPLDRADHTTRFLAVFADEIPARVGPVCDSRAYIADIALEWDGLYVSSGDPAELTEGYPPLADSGLRFTADYSGGAIPYFYTDKTVTSAEGHTLFFKALDYADANYSYFTAQSDARFSFESGVYYEKGKSFTSVGLPFTSSDADRVVFTYDAATNLLTRSDKNSKSVLGVSKSLTPADNALGYESVPITVQNLIVQYVRVSTFDSLYRTVEVTGNGDCMYFINGQYIFGHWSRPSLNEATSYTLYDGTPVRLEPGTTWIELMPTKHEIKIRNDS